MSKLFKWLSYFLAVIFLLVTAVLATAYWNRDKLLAKLTAELNKGINGKFHIEKIDFTFLHEFPSFSITLHNVYLRDNQYEKYPHDVFSAEKIFVSLRLYPLVKKEVRINSLAIDEASIFIFKTRNGDTNMEILKKTEDSLNVKKPSSETPAILNLKKVKFKNVSVAFSDSLKNKFINFQFLDTQQSFTQSDSGFNVKVDGRMHFDSLFLNPKSGSYLKDKMATVSLNVDINQLSHRLFIRSSSLTYLKNEIVLSGDFNLRKEGPYTLGFQGKNVNQKEVIALLNPKLMRTLEKFKLLEPVTVQVQLAGRSIPGYKPSVDASFETTQKTFKYKSVDFSSLKLKGSFTNHIDEAKVKDNKNSKVTISTFSALMENVPVSGSITFTELQDPTIALSMRSKGSFDHLRNHIDNDRFSIDKGSFATEVKYNGKLSEYLDPNRTSYQGKLNGQITTSNVSVHYKAKKIKLDKIQFRSTFNEKIVTIHELKMDVNGSPVSITGKIQNFIPFFITPKNKGYVNLIVHSPDFDLTSFTSKRSPKKKSEAQNKQNRKKMSDLLDMVYHKLEFDIGVTVDKFTFRKFQASDFKGKLRLNNNVVRANPISMKVADGSMNLNFSLDRVFDPVSPMTVDAKIINANIHELFLLFNNFNQKTLHADNIRGRISADVKFSANVNEDYTLLTPSMRGTLTCKITNGGLKDFEPMENMSNFLFKKRDFSDVEFAELNSNFSIAGTDMDISRMEIQSSVLSLFLEGRYSFTDSTSLSVQLPLSNLKKRHKDFKPKNIGTDSKAGPSVYLHVYRDKDINSKIQIDYDPFKKWAKN
ncbi:MAG TPA: AsmA family protein [Chryseolinea sp.]